MTTTTTGRATDFITFSRTSNATVTGADGRIRWAGHNLLTNSESFDAASWTKTNLVTTNMANVVVAPNGTTTADQLVASTANDQHVIDTVVNVTGGVQYTIGVFAKAGAEATIIVGVVQRASGSYLGQYNVTYNMSTQSGSAATNGATPPTNNSYSVTPLSNGWFYISVTSTLAATANTCSPNLYLRQTSAYAGNGTDGLYVWGAHLYRSDLGGMVLNPARGDAYYPTTPRNLLGSTEDFSAAAWTKEASTAVANAALSPNGLTTASRITEAATSAVHAVSQVATVVASPYTFSVYLKKGTGSTTPDWVQIAFGGVSFDWVNFSLTGSGSVGNSSSVGIGAITAVGDGWYRCSVRTTPTAGSMSAQIVFTNNTNAASRRPSYAGATTSDILVWGAQLSDSASLDAYSPVYGAAVTSAAYYAPRLDYDANGSALGLLVEEQRTNIVPTSSNFTVAGWQKGNTGTAVAPVVTVNDAVAPDGTLTAQKVVFDRGSGNTVGDSSFLDHNVGGYANATTYTSSVYVKAATAGDVGKQLAWRHVGGSNYGVITLTASWQRVTRTETSGSTSGAISFVSRGTISADNTVGAHIWGVSLEVGASNAATTFPTSLIVTNGAQATRTADVASVSTQAFPYSSTAASIVASFDYLGGSAVLANNQITVSLRGSSGNLIYLYNGNGVATGYCAVGGADQAFLTRNAVAANVQTKLAFAFKANDFAASQDGGAIASDTSGSLPSAAPELTIGSSGINSAHLNGHIRQITYLPRRISNTELQTRTS